MDERMYSMVIVEPRLISDCWTDEWLVHRNWCVKLVQNDASRPRWAGENGAVESRE